MRAASGRVDGGTDRMRRPSGDLAEQERKAPAAAPGAMVRVVFREALVLAENLAVQHAHGVDGGATPPRRGALDVNFDAAIQVFGRLDRTQDGRDGVGIRMKKQILELSMAK